MGGHGADLDGTALVADALELGDVAEIDDIRGRGEALLQGRDQGLTAGHERTVGSALKSRGGIGDRAGFVHIKFIHSSWPPYSAA